ncbi:hypothetical protein ACF1BQ_005010 [Bradyrhizobium sp. RDT10]
MVVLAMEAIKRKLWNRLLGEDSWIGRYGTFRDRERFGLISRPNYIYGMLRAADCAKYFGKTRVTAIEFGVASGAGLLNMADVAQLIQAETGVEFRIVGFDTGRGLPQVQGYRDHPEIWNPGDFAMEDRDALSRKLAGRAEIIWGDIADTVDAFTSAIDPEAPVGFVSIDVDIYSATKSALRCLTGRPEQYLPAVSMYFDDVGFFLRTNGVENSRRSPNSTSSTKCERLEAIEAYLATGPKRRTAGTLRCMSATSWITRRAKKR